MLSRESQSFLTCLKQSSYDLVCEIEKSTSTNGDGIFVGRITKMMLSCYSS